MPKGLKDLCLLGLMLLFTPQNAPAQAEAALDCFVESSLTGKGKCEPSPVVSVGEVMLDPNDYPAELVTEIVRGLQRLALSSSDSRVRLAAVGWLALKGEISEEHSAETIEELEEIYFRSPYGDVRRGIASKIRLQLAKKDAVSFLERAAAAPSASDETSVDLPSPRIALHSLASMGEEGRAALRRLYAAEAVTNPVAKRYLKNLSTVNFRLPRD